MTSGTPRTRLDARLRWAVLGVIVLAVLATWVVWTLTRDDSAEAAVRHRAEAAIDACADAEAYGETWDTEGILGYRPSDRLVVCLKGHVNWVSTAVGGIIFEICYTSGGRPPITWSDCWQVTWTEPLPTDELVQVIGVVKRAPPPADAPEGSYWLEPYVDGLAVRRLHAWTTRQ